jgi:hypothetical protein
MRRFATSNTLLLGVSLLLGLLWLTEWRPLAYCPWQYCSPGPTWDCTFSYYTYMGSTVTICPGYAVGDCHMWICWYRDDAGICWNEDQVECWLWP